MKINIVGRQMNVYDDTRLLIENKLTRLDKYFKSGAEPEATVTLSRKNNVSSVDVTINAAGTLFRSEVRADDFRDAMDQTVEHIEGQIRKNKTKLAKRLRENVMDMSIIPDPAEEAEEDEIIIRVKQFEFKPMSPEEAIMQMNLLGHSFFAFRDQDAGDVFAVVYRRNDGDYGLIEDEEG